MEKIIEYRSHAKSKNWNRFFGVLSSNGKDYYTVSCYFETLDNHGLIRATNWACSCPHWINHVPRPTCKHIQQVMRGITTKQTFAFGEMVGKAAEKFERFLARYDNSFDAGEIDKETPVKKQVRKENEIARQTFDALEF